MSDSQPIPGQYAWTGEISANAASPMLSESEQDTPELSSGLEQFFSEGRNYASFRQHSKEAELEQDTQKLIAVAGPSCARLEEALGEHHAEAENNNAKTEEEMVAQILQFEDNIEAFREAKETLIKEKECLQTDIELTEVVAQPRQQYQCTEGAAPAKCNIEGLHQVNKALEKEKVELQTQFEKEKSSVS
ncbi:hypothetical protein L208DRAFT_1374425 [Tricholoma matsutake]|nr:hypothetical protein L208DRAFT_1374425 [Tricholoma matsutake 945]